MCRKRFATMVLMPLLVAPQNHANHQLQPSELDSLQTFADGLATRHCYEMTFPALLAGLEDFTTVTEPEIADAVRALHAAGERSEGAGATGLAGLTKLAPRLAGKTCAIIMSGGNIDEDLWQRLLAGDHA